MWAKEGAELSSRMNYPESTAHAHHHTGQAHWLRYTLIPLGVGFIVRMTGMDGDKISEEGICLSFQPE